MRGKGEDDVGPSKADYPAVFAQAGASSSSGGETIFGVTIPMAFDLGDENASWLRERGAPKYNGAPMEVTVILSPRMGLSCDDIQSV